MYEYKILHLPVKYIFTLKIKNKKKVLQFITQKQPTLVTCLPAVITHLHNT
jgi:hypothetical protein